jgi:predicted dienelactone hydrolase
MGCRPLACFDSVQNAPLPAWLLYPTAEAAAPARFGPYALDLAMNGAPAGEARLPLVAISHGNGGSPWSYRGMAGHLVREGFAVLMLEHPGNNSRDNSLGSPTGRLKVEALRHRPRHVRLAVDAALGDALAGARLERDRYAMVGHSAGGYTALAVAGGHAMTVPDEVEDARLLAPDAELAKLAFPVPTEPDRRLASAVLLAPAIGFFLADGALRDVEIPLLVRTAGHDAICSASKVAEALRSVPDPARVSSLDVEDAGHFSFQSPFPPELAHIPPAQDPPGFDRVRYQATLHAEIAAFLRATS